MYPQEILDLSRQVGVAPEEVVKLRALPSEELKALIRTYAYSPVPGPLEYQVKAVKDLAIPHLIEIVASDDAFDPPAGNPSGDRPGFRALLLLAQGKHEALKPALKKWASSANEYALNRIAGHLTAYGSDDLLPEVRFLFEHPDSMISSAARGGALAPFKEGRAEAEFKRYVWDHCSWLLNTPDPPHGYDPIRLLILIDQDRTRELLQDPKTLRPDHALLPTILSTLKKLESPPPPDVLIQLMDSKAQAPKRQEEVDRVASSLLLSQGHPRADAYIEQVLTKPDAYDEFTVMSAWDGRFRLAGSVPFYDVAFEEHITGKIPLEALQPDHRAVFLLDELNSEIKNGGLDQWFFNGGGAHAKEVIQALKRFGMKKHAKVIDSAAGVFGFRGVPADLEKMRDRMAKLSGSSSAKLRDLDYRWEELPWWRILAAEWDWKRQQG